MAIARMSIGGIERERAFVVPDALSSLSFGMSGPTTSNFVNISHLASVHGLDHLALFLEPTRVKNALQTARVKACVRTYDVVGLDVADMSLSEVVPRELLSALVDARCEA